MDARKVVAAALLGATLAVIPATTVRAQDVSAQIPKESRYRYRLLGVYDKDSGDPVDGVEITDILSGTKTVTSKIGVISLFFLPDGGSIVRIRKVGYELQTIPVSITPADTFPLTIVLARATQLPTVVVNDSAPKARPISGNLRSFEERSKQGFGYFITEAEMRKNDDRALSQIVTAHMPGIIAIPKSKNGTETYLVSARKECDGPAFSKCSGTSCPVQMYLDGVQLPSPVDASRLRTEDYAGAEFYAGGASVPLKYNKTGSACGVLLLWTRER